MFGNFMGFRVCYALFPQVDVFIPQMFGLLHHLGLQIFIQFFCVPNLNSQLVHCPAQLKFFICHLQQLLCMIAFKSLHF